MTEIRIHKSFMNDILEHADASFAKRVLKCLYDESQGIANQVDDHKYKGIPNAWIRYISKGKSAYRIIYISDGKSKIFFRCGNHSVEDRLAEPKENEEIVKINFSDEMIEEMTNPLAILTNHDRPLIYGSILRRKLIPNKSVYIVSPYIDPTLLYRASKIGRVLDAIKSSGTDVIIISSAERVSEFDKLWKDLEARGIDIVFLKNLHSKIYLFVTDKNHHHHLSETPSLGIIGSSNLTKRGFSETLKGGNYEANYSVASESIEELETLAVQYYNGAMDYRKAVNIMKKSKNI